jgi:hypothetical protein
MNLTFGPFFGEPPLVESAYQKGSTAEYALDVDMTTGALKPLRTDRRVSSSTGRTLYADDCCILTNPACAKITKAEYSCERVFATRWSPYAYPIQATPDDACAGVWCRMGFPCISSAPTVTYGDSPEGQEQITLDNGEVVTKGHVTVRSYFYRYRNKFGDWGPPSPASEIQILDFSDPAIVEDFATPPPEYCITEIGVYALIAGVEDGSSAAGGGTNEYFLVGTFPVGSQQSFTHDPLALPLFDAFVSHGECAIHDDAYDMQWFGSDRLVYMAGDNRMHFTEPGNYNVTHEKYALSFRDRPLRMVATDSYAYVLTCGQPEVVDLSKDCDQGGCKKVVTIAEPLPLIGSLSPVGYEGSVYYASTSGVVVISGSKAVVLTDGVFDQDQWDALQPHTMKLAVHRGYLYMASDVETYRLKLPNTPYMKPTGADIVRLSIRPTAFFRTKDDRLLFTAPDGVFELEAGSSFKTGIWRSKRHLYRAPTKFSAVRAECDMPGVEAKLFIEQDNGIGYTQVVDVLPYVAQSVDSARTFSMQVELKVRAKIVGFGVASSVKDFQSASV